MKKMTKWQKRGCIAVAVAAVCVVAGVLVKTWMFPPYEELPPTGEHEVLMTTYTWEDESRVETFTDTGENRALTVKFWYPKEAGEYPLVIFSHGAFGVIDSNYSTCMELASNGYVVASIGHPYHAMFVEDVNGKTTIVDMEFMKQVYADNGADTPEGERRVYEFSKEWMALRTKDMNFVLDTILEKAAAETEAPFNLVDKEKIGLFGHSMGGATAVQLGRERKDIDAVIDLEGTMMGEYVDFANGTEVYNDTSYEVPVLDVNSKAVREDISALEKTNTDWEYVNDYLGKNATDYREVIFNGAGHLNFTDLPMISPPLAGMLGVGEVDARECMENVNEVVRIFFDYHLKSEGALEQIQTEY